MTRAAFLMTGAANTLEYSTPCRGHVWRRVGGSRKEYWFECGLCGETREKRLGTDTRVLRALALRTTMFLALLAACALPVAAQEPEPDAPPAEESVAPEFDPFADLEFDDQVETPEPEAETEPERQGRILAVLYCPVLEGEPDPEATTDAPGCTAGVGAALAWHDTRQGRVSLVGALSPDSLAIGLGWSWRESGVPFGLAVGVAIPYDGAGVYPDAAALVVGVSASVAQLLGRGGGE